MERTTKQMAQFLRDIKFCFATKMFSDDLLECAEKLDELAAYEDAEEQGLLVRLPCKVGDTLFDAEDPELEVQVQSIGFYLETEHGGDWEHLHNIGKTVFLIREEAESALEGMK